MFFCEVAHTLDAVEVVFAGSGKPLEFLEVRRKDCVFRKIGQKSFVLS